MNSATRFKIILSALFCFSVFWFSLFTFGFNIALPFALLGFATMIVLIGIRLVLEAL